MDFQEIKVRFPILKVAELLGLEIKKQANGQFRGCCPIHDGNDPRGFVITPEKGLFYCFKGCGGGDQLALISMVKKVTVQEAALWLVGGDERPAKVASDFQPIDYLEPNHEAVVAAGLEPEVAEAIGAGYAPKGTMRGNVLVPIRLPDGTLIGYIGVEEIIPPPRWHLPNQKVVKLRRSR